jgi:hypothetical protein
MKTISKLIYWTSLALILLLVVVPFIGQFTPLEISNESFQDAYLEFRFYGLPIIILLTLFGTIKPQNSSATKATKIFLTIGVSLFSIFILFITLFAGMCRWTDNEILFNNVNDNTTHIILRDFGCGATDSGQPSYKVCKIKNILPSLIWVTDFDTTKIDRKVWKRTNKED